MRVAIADPDGFAKHRFFISVNAGNTRIDELQDLFQHVSKLAGSQSISELIRRSLSGITLIPLPVAPAELKPEVNTFYFRVDTDSELWREIIETRDIITLHIDSRVPDPRVRFFAIR